MTKQIDGGARLAPRIEINFNTADAAQICRENLSQHQEPAIRQVSGSAFIQVSMFHWNNYQEKNWRCLIQCPANNSRCQKLNPQDGPFSR
ncbi:hypothetical protein BI308_17210 [Roseofilum reptotaenium AO1-A]|uniref:Uncharacterized protein n=1 Tax=Roseofilum reptotaenium AO1-A TaxID=1925591 RepID=A0A1L9QNT6_9CYAN|nr:hypothetical protein BI308_17210 [Roseofilum reptotaenium AO1-A]